MASFVFIAKKRFTVKFRIWYYSNYKSGTGGHQAQPGGTQQAKGNLRDLKGACGFPFACCQVIDDKAGEGGTFWE